MKALLRRLFAEALAQLDPRAAMTAGLARYRDRAARGERFLVLAYGKAARAMAAAVVEQLPGARLRGLAVVPEGHGAALPPFEVIAGGHPLPTEGSLRAGKRALELARSVAPDETVLFLASGGGSAMMESPIDAAVTLDELRTLHHTLVGAGLGIVAMNVVRERVSAVKGGRLALAAAAAREHATFVLSDVPDAAEAEVASRPSLPHRAALEPRAHAHCVSILDRHELWPAVPDRLRVPLRAGTLPPPTDTGHRPTSLFAAVGSNGSARSALAVAARARGIAVVLDADRPVPRRHVSPETDERTPEAAALLHAVQLARLHRRWPGRRVAVIAGGELSVPLPRDPGTGGRNQQFVLACARVIRGQPITVLSAGTDGIDGNSPAAGALGDGHTMARARALGLDVHGALARCDAFPLLDALRDTVVTGPTGTNVRDVRILVHAG